MAKQTKNTLNNVDRFNKIKVAILNNGGKKATPNQFTLNGSDIKFKLPQTVTITGNKGTTTLDVNEKKHLVILVSFIKENGTKKAQPQKAATVAQKENKTMAETTYLDPAKISASLIKNGWKVDEYGILTSKADVQVKFNLKSVRIVNGELIANIPSATTTTAQLVEYLKAVAGGNKPSIKQTKKLTIPDGYADFMNAQSELEKKAKKKIADKKKKQADKEKPEPKAVENPTPGKSPVFDSLNVAITETEKADNLLAAAWSVIAVNFKYSIKGLTDALHAEGKWPNKINSKTGEPILSPDGYYQAAGYKSVYDLERGKDGIKGVGHMVNTASRMFAKYNPELEAARAKAADAQKANQQKVSENIVTDVDQVLIEMSKLAKILSSEDLQSWLETDPSVKPLWAEMTGEESEGETDLDSLVEDDDEELLDSLEPELEDVIEDEDEDDLLADL